AGATSTRSKPLPWTAPNPFAARRVAARRKRLRARRARRRSCSRWHRAGRRPIIPGELSFHDTIPAPTRRFAMMTLYYAPGACSMAAHIVLEESGEKYQPQQVDLAGGEQRTEAYLKINPQGRVPVLRLDNGEPL